MTLQYVALTTTDPLLKSDIFALLGNGRVVRLGATGAPTVVTQGSQYRFTRLFQMDWATYCGLTGAMQLFTFAYTTDPRGGLKNTPFIGYNVFEAPTRPASCSLPKYPLTTPPV